MQLIDVLGGVKGNVLDGLYHPARHHDRRKQDVPLIYSYTKYMRTPGSMFAYYLQGCIGLRFLFFSQSKTGVLT
jgi:hypothetical protein